MTDYKRLIVSMIGPCSVRRGRGTAHRWLYIETSEPVNNKLKVEEALVKAGHCGTYWDDQFGEFGACVLWSVK